MPSNRHRLETLGILRRELQVGVVSYVTAQVARFNVNSAGSPSGTHFDGGRYGRGEVGEFVIIEGQVNHVLGRIIELRLPEKDRRAVNPGPSHREELDAVGAIQLLGSVASDSLRVTAGVQAYPRLGDKVYAAPHELLAELPRLMEPAGKSEDAVRLNLGSIDAASGSDVEVLPERLLGRHCAILGSTGGGKSWTTARVIEECIKHNAKIILLDATGEYREFRGEGIQHYHLGEPQEKAHNSISSSLPPTSFVESDFIAMFEPSGKVQAPKLMAAMRSLRLARLRPDLADKEGLLIKIDKFPNRIEQAEVSPDVSERISNPSSEFNVRLLGKQIQQECVALYPSNQKWYHTSNDYSYCIPLVSRINGVVSSPAFTCVFEETQSPIEGCVKGFLLSDSPLMCLCLSGVSHEYKAREIIANAIGRMLLTMARKGDFKKKPVVVFLDEAHHFLGRHIGSEDTVAKLDAFELIAKEGRKYGLTICLATQRPRDITEGVLSQMGTLIVHRLTNDRDREVVERACGEIDRSAASFLPTLRPGEAAIVGAGFPIPLTIQMHPPASRPLSDGPKYQEAWAKASAPSE